MKNIKLNNLREWEEIECVIRRHWIVFILIKIYILIGIILSFIMFMIFWLSAFSILLNLVFWMFFSQYIVIAWMNHELDLIVVTNNRIICVEQVSFLNRAVWECNLGQVQEISTQTKWVLSNIFNYGTIIIKTAWNTNNFDMTFAPNVMQMQRQMLNIVDHYRDTHRIKDSINTELNK